MKPQRFTHFVTFKHTPTVEQMNFSPKSVISSILDLFIYFLSCLVDLSCCVFAADLLLNVLQHVHVTRPEPVCSSSSNSLSPATAHSVISEDKSQCFRILGPGSGPSSCSLPILRSITKQICCCSRVGKAWGPDCERCPYFGSGQQQKIYPDLDFRQFH